jgi:hypothetical protein
VEDIELRSILGSAFVLELFEADVTSAKYEAIIRHIRSYVVYMAISKGIMELKKQPTEKGLIFETQSADGFKADIVASEEIKITAKFNHDVALRYMESAIDYMKNNATDYPTYIAYAGVTSTTELTYKRDNKNKKTFWL